MRHAGAIERFQAEVPCFATAIGRMLAGWQLFATEHKRVYGVFISENDFEGPKWHAIGETLLELLSSDLDGWDRESLEQNIRECTRENGC